MDQLHHLGPQDDLPLRRGDILAQLERCLVDLADHALVMGDVVIGVFQPLHQAQAPAVDHAFLCGGIAQQRVGRRKAVDDDVGDEIGAVALQLVQLQIVQPAAHAFLHGQVILRTRLEERVVLPRRVHEPLVLGIGREVGFAGHDFKHVGTHRLRMAHGAGRIAGGFAQQQRDGPHEILARKTDQRPQRSGRLRGLVAKMQRLSRCLSRCFGHSSSLANAFVMKANMHGAR